MHILSLADKYGITFIQAYITNHPNVEVYYLLWEKLVLEWHSSYSSSIILTLNSTASVEGYYLLWEKLVPKMAFLT